MLKYIKNEGKAMGNFWINKKGEEIHEDLISPIDKLKTEMVEKLVKKAKQKREELEAFKREVEEEINDYLELLLQEYKFDALKNSIKGNITFENFSGTKKISIAVADKIDFNEKLNIAKIKVDEYLKKLTKDSNPQLRTLILKAFEVDKKGNVSASKILALKSYSISDPEWLEAMRIIDDAIEISGSKSYIRFYERESPSDKYNNIILDFSKI